MRQSRQTPPGQTKMQAGRKEGRKAGRQAEERESRTKKGEEIVWRIAGWIIRT